MIPLADLIANPTRAEDIQLQEVPALMTQLAALQTVLAARLIDEQAEWDKSQGNGDRLMEVGEAAQKIGVSEDWLYRRSDKLPFAVHMGRKVRFSEQGIEKYIRQRMGR
jgi:predicted DNA-binding transcriptional regulator AlpA